MVWVPKCLFRQDASNDMQHYLLMSIRDLDPRSMSRPKVKVSNCFVKTHIMICNMTYLCQSATLTQGQCPDPRSRSQIDLNGSCCTSFDAN